MKRTLALIFAAVFALAFVACGKTEPTPEPPTETTPQPAYSWEIQTTLEETRGNIEFEFSRPVFEGASPLADAANRMYDEMEAAYKANMEEAAADYAEDAGNAPWNFTELSECAYDRDGVLSFITVGDWFMGGVHNSWVTGHTFDFNLGRELKIADFLHGDDARITAALLALFAQEVDADDDLADARAQSGPDANFYLDGDGVHVFYMPYVVPATQNGVDILISWGSPLLTANAEVRSAAQPEETIIATESETTDEPEETAEAKIPQTKEELAAYFNRVTDQVKLDKPGYTWTQQTLVRGISSPSSAIEWLAAQALRFVPEDVLAMDPVAKGADHRDFGVWDQAWGSRLTPQMAQNITLTDKGSTWELRADLRPEKRGSLAKNSMEHDHSKVFKVYTYDQIHGAIEPFARLGRLEEFAPSYHSSWAILTIDKETDRLLKGEYMLVMDGYFKAKPAVFPALEATATISQHEIYKIG